MPKADCDAALTHSGGGSALQSASEVPILNRVPKLLPSLVALLLALASFAGAAQGRSAATHTQWVAKVNAACLRWQKPYDRLPKRNGTLAQLLVVFPKLTALSASLLADIRHIPSAPVDRRLVARLYSAWDDEIAHDQTAYARLKRGDMRGFKAEIKRSVADDTKETLLLLALGTTCHRTS
jgi:hypothetical protein